MNLKTFALGLALVISPITVFGADNAIVGTWKQNLAKSKYNPGPAPTIPATLRVETVGDGEKLSVDGTGADGKATSWNYTAAYDGKPVSVIGSPYGDMAALKRINDRTTQITYTKAGKVTRTSTRVVSSDGKTLTITATGTNAKGEKYDNTVLYERR